MRAVPRKSLFRHLGISLALVMGTLFLLARYIGWPQLLPMPNIEPVPPADSRRSVAGYTITNTSRLANMRNVLWHCIMTPLDDDPQIPISNLGEFQRGRQGANIPPGGSERGECQQAATLHQEGMFDVFISVDYEIEYEIMLAGLSLRPAFKRHVSRSDLTWRLEHDGGKWLN
jgi:hypothetical protein